MSPARTAHGARHFFVVVAVVVNGRPGGLLAEQVVVDRGGGRPVRRRRRRAEAAVFDQHGKWRSWILGRRKCDEQRMVRGGALPRVPRCISRPA